MRWRLFLVAAALSAALPACTALPDDVRLGPFPACDITYTPPAPSSRGRLLLMAQAVPDAFFIPCFLELPPGWAFHGVATRSGEATLRVETDTFDLEVAVRLTEDCAVEVDQASPVARSDEALVPLWVPLYRSQDGMTLTYAFEGGCVRVEYPTRALAESSEGRELFSQIHLMSRDRLRELSGWEL